MTQSHGRGAPLPPDLTKTEPLLVGHREECLSPSLPLRHRSAVEALPDLTQRIEKLGLTEEYLAFKERYLAWRKGETSGARGEIAAEQITRPEHVAANRGFAYWYPSVQEWMWKRTLSYWIAVTFFEGSIFFMVSSFMFNQEEALGGFFNPMTLYGYCAGKVLFFTCCYFMCLETINLHICEGDELLLDGEEEEPFYWWPYRYQIALRNLERAGVGPLPYYVSAVYLTGVLCFTVGLVVELAPSLAFGFNAPVLLSSFLVGALLFALGGVLECMQNKVFTTRSIFTLGGAGAATNLMGGLFFTAGAVLQFFDGRASSNAFGVGSALYMLSSSLQIVMWKDEQFGLTFLSVLNNLGSPAKLASMAQNNGDENDSHAHFSTLGAFFIHVYCVCGAASMYNFNIEMRRATRETSFRSFQVAANEFLPCFIAHMMLALTSAVMRSPKIAPFRQLYRGARWFCLLLTVNSSCTLWEFLVDRIHF